MSETFDRRCPFDATEWISSDARDVGQRESLV